jgi:hypothetical protein
VQNICLLLKFSYKTLQQDNTPWRIWITDLSPYPLSQEANNSSLGKLIYKNIATLSAITQCSISSGKNTMFWQDRWLLHEPLAKTHPAIFSHHLSPNAMVCEVLEVGLSHGLRNRLTPVAAAELASLLSLLQDIQLTEGKDRRTMLDGATFSTKAAYNTLQDSQQDDLTQYIWGSRLPGKIKIFGWLFHLDRLNT